MTEIPDDLVEFAQRLVLDDGARFTPTPHQVAVLRALDPAAPNSLDLVAGKRPGLLAQWLSDVALAHAIATGREVRVISRDSAAAAAMTRRAIDILRGLGIDADGTRLTTDREDPTR